MIGVAAGFQRVVELAHALGGADVDGVLRLDVLGPVAGDEAEQADMLVQVLQCKFGRPARGQVVHAKAREVADDDDLRQVALCDAGEVAQRLAKGRVQAAPTRLLLDQQHAGPEQVHISLAATVLLDVELEGGDALVGDAEDLEEGDPEGLGLGVFVGGVRPVLGEGQGLVLDFVPGQGHGSSGGWWARCLPCKPLTPPSPQRGEGDRLPGLDPLAQQGWR